MNGANWDLNLTLQNAGNPKLIIAFIVCLVMEKTKKAPRKSKASPSIAEAYIQYILLEGKQPASVFAFCKHLGIEESEFYDQFGSFESLEKAIWKGFFTSTLAILEKDKNYTAFTAREKVLTFYYSFTEVLKQNRSFVLLQLNDWKHPATNPSILKGIKKQFDPWITNILNEAKATKEISSRPYLEKQYPTLLWVHFLFILHFWVKDDSAGFERTDMAIEKSVTLAFDALAHGLFEQVIDFGKFLYQQVKY